MPSLAMPSAVPFMHFGLPSPNGPEAQGFRRTATEPGMSGQGSFANAVPPSEWRVPLDVTAPEGSLRSCRVNNAHIQRGCGGRCQTCLSLIELQPLKRRSVHTLLSFVDVLEQIHRRPKPAADLP